MWGLGPPGFRGLQGWLWVPPVAALTVLGLPGDAAAGPSVNVAHAASTGTVGTAGIAVPSIDLGTLGGRDSWAYGVDGDIVVGASTLPGDSVSHAFAYDLATGHKTDLGTLGGSDSWAYAVDSDIVVGASTLPGDSVSHAFAYYLTTGQMTDLGTLGGNNSWAYGVAGDIVVGGSENSTSPRRAFAYDLSTGQMTDLGTGGWEFGEARGVSGTTVVGGVVNYKATSGFAYDLTTGDMRVGLGLADRSLNFAIDVDGDFVVGRAAGAADVGDPPTHGFVYDLISGEAKDLGTLGGRTSEATAVDGDAVVGYSDRPRRRGRHAVAWTMETNPPVSKAFSRAHTRQDTIQVTYRCRDAGSGVNRVQLWVRKPGESGFVKRRVDTRWNIDHQFVVAAKRIGRYRFYTVARDNWGNWESVPTTADAITVRLR